MDYQCSCVRLAATEWAEGPETNVFFYRDHQDVEKAKTEILAIAPIFDGQTWDSFAIPEYKAGALNGAGNSESQPENTKPEATPEANPSKTTESRDEAVEGKDSKTSEVDKSVDAGESSKP